MINRGVNRIYEILRAEIAKEKKLRKKTDKDLAADTGLTLSTIRAFMCGARGTDKTADVLARALGIKR
jgi:transcriptional regulator with XRE-family HTH domain